MAAKKSSGKAMSANKGQKVPAVNAKNGGKGGGLGPQPPKSTKVK